jgi:2',3'-cyclic-nucleotide 2'-phosphodiesterase
MITFFYSKYFMADTLRFMFIGDIIGQPGLSVFQKWAPRLKEKYAINMLFVNGENANKNGMGLTVRNIDILKEAGADVVTTGNHVFDQKEVYMALRERSDVIRPANYPPTCPGKGYTLINVLGHTVAIVNMHGRVGVRELLDCPFRTMESLLTFLRTRTNVIFVDFHAETTAEKRAFGAFLDGKVTGVYGTHTHIQTADEFIMPGGTSYATDLGGCGALNSVIGMQQDLIISRFMVHAKMGKFVVETRGPIVLSGVWGEVDIKTGKTLSIERIRIIDDEITHTLEREAS